MNIAQFKKGEMIIGEGMTERKAYLIKEGKVEIFTTINKRRLSLAVLGANQIIGEMSMFDSRPRSASVLALEDTTAIVFYKDTVDKEFEKLEPWMKGFFRVIVGRLRSANEVVNPMKRGNYLHSIAWILKNMGDLAAKAVPRGQEKGVIKFPRFQAASEIERVLLAPPDMIQEALKSLEVFGMLKLVDPDDGESLIIIEKPELLEKLVKTLQEQLFHREPPSILDLKSKVDQEIDILTQVLQKHERDGVAADKHFFKARGITVNANTLNYDELVSFFRGTQYEDYFLVDDDKFHYSYEQLKGQFQKVSEDRNILHICISYLKAA